MPGLFMEGEEKARAGVYRRHEEAGGGQVATAMDGVFCMPVHAEFGPVGEVRKVPTKSALESLYMQAGTVDAAAKLFEMGANTVYVYRLGSGGTKGTLAVKDTEGNVAATLATAYETALPFTVTLKQKLGDEAMKECSIHNGTALVEKISFASGGDEAGSLVEAMKDSGYLTAAKASGDGAGSAAVELETVAQAPLAGGAAPTVTNGDYGDAFLAFEPYRWNALVLDTVDSSVQAIAKSFMDRIHGDGALGICIIGEASTSSLATRMANAKSYNAPHFVYCGGGFLDASGSRVDGYLGVAAQAGVIGCKGSGGSIVHAEIPGAESCTERLTDAQYVEAVKSGLLLLSEGPEGQVWFDSGVNTYTVLSEGDDRGWQKIKRVAVRHEAFDRIGRTLEPLVGKISCDADGVENVVQQAKLVLAEMAREGKILDTYEFYEDMGSPHAADHAHFICRIDDIDSLEKVYLTYRFQYAG